jgi:hypothetical protein
MNFDVQKVETNTLPAYQLEDMLFLTLVTFLMRNIGMMINVKFSVMNSEVFYKKIIKK